MGKETQIALSAADIFGLAKPSPSKSKSTKSKSTSKSSPSSRKKATPDKINLFSVEYDEKLSQLIIKVNHKLKDKADLEKITFTNSAEEIAIQILK